MREDVVGDSRCTSVGFNFCRFPESGPLILLKELFQEDKCGLDFVNSSGNQAYFSDISKIFKFYFLRQGD